MSLQNSDPSATPSASPYPRTAVKKALTIGVGMATAGLVLVAQAPAQSASGTRVTCGQRITSSIRLANNLHNCPGSGLIVGADHIVIDLAGHTIDGSNAPGSTGISDVGHQHVLVKNGTIHGFFVNGVTLRNAPGSTVRGLTIDKIGAGGAEPDFSAGVHIENSPRSSVIRTTVKNDVKSYQSDGIDVLSSARTLLSKNRLLSNSFNGAFVVNSPSSRVIGNRFDGNQNQGIGVNSGSQKTLIKGNTANHNGDNGIVVGAVRGVRVVHNSTDHNAAAGLFFFDLIKSSIRGNEASGNSDGIDVSGGQHGSHGDRVSGNVTTGNGEVGLAVFEAADNNVIDSNRADANQGDGIVVGAATGNVLTSNISSRNVGVGIGVYEDSPGDSAGNTLTGNTANRNGAHGMDTPSGTIDGGANAARLNTPLPNCIGVVCT